MDYIWENFLVILLPFFCYYLGIAIRMAALPGKKKLGIGRQFLLGVPVSLVVVSPFIPIIYNTRTDFPAYLVTLGLIMEHGMIFNETLTYHLSGILKKQRIPGL